MCFTYGFGVDLADTGDLYEDKNGKEKDTVHDQSVNEDSGDSLNEESSNKERGS